MNDQSRSNGNNKNNGYQPTNNEQRGYQPNPNGQFGYRPVSQATNSNPPAPPKSDTNATKSNAKP